MTISALDFLMLLQQYTAIEKPQYQRLRYFAQDESRFGLKTTVGRLMTSLGVKPLGTWQWQFKAFWLYGAVEPTTGEQFFLQFTHVDSACYQLFLDQFSQAYPLWQHLKKDLRWGLFKNLDQLQTKVDKLLADLTTDTVASVTGFSFILDALSDAGIF
ncbi:hypothetical protein ACQ4M3_06860 [Leptolyngbya sp. AN03gr2]|uniref:hypothetical protein n=1 Tax=unclassified Leptolyngbya TaxID=2650499 RepID=UPI003D31DFDA